MLTLKQSIIIPKRQGMLIIVFVKNKFLDTNIFKKKYIKPKEKITEKIKEYPIKWTESDCCKIHT